MRITPLRLLAFGYPCLAVVGQYPLGTIGGIPLSLERLVMLVLGPLCVVQMLVGADNVRRILRFTPRAIVVGVGLWLLALVMSHALSGGTDDAVMFYGYVQKLLLAILFACAVASEPDARLAVRWFALSTLVASVLTFYVYRAQGAGSIRSAGFVNVDFGDVSLVEGIARAGAVGGIPVMACWLEAVYARSQRKKVLWYLGMAALFAATILALRREYLLSLSVSIAWGIFTLPLGLRKVTVAAVAAGFFAIGYTIVVALPEWRLRLFDETVETFGAGQDPRLLMLQTAPHLFMEKPLTGFGVGSFPSLMARSLPLHLATTEQANQFYASGLASHNSFLTAALETGVIGLMGVILLIGSTGVWAVRVWQASRRFPGNPLAHFAPIFFVPIFFSVFIQDGLASNMNWSYLALLVAIIAVERSKLAAAAAQWHRQRLAGRHPTGGRGPNLPLPSLKHVRNPRLD